MAAGTIAAHWLTLHGLVTVAAVLLYVGTSRVMQQRRNPTAAIAWVLFILLLPYLALPAYLIFGSRKLARPHLTTVRDKPRCYDANNWAILTSLALGQPAPAAYRDLHVHRDGADARHALFEIIDTARESIAVSTFILSADELGEAVVSRLCERARSGVHVRLLIDGLGSLMAGRPNLQRLTDAGGTWVLFVPSVWSPRRGRFNLRDHRKLIITDAEGESGRLWCGGRNLAAEYFDGLDGAPPWRDLSFDLRGPFVCQGKFMFERDWAFANLQPFDGGAPCANRAEDLAQGAQLIASGPDQADDTIHALLLTAAYQARTRIALVTPYFVPDVTLLMALCLAARRGVVVDLLIPARSNHWLSDLVRGRALRSLAQAGARIWLAPVMVHAKLVIIDDRLALAGSANLDTRGLFLNYELMVAFHNPPDVERFATWFEDEKREAKSYCVTSPGTIRDIAEGMLLWLAFQL